MKKRILSGSVIVLVLILSFVLNEMFFTLLISACSIIGLKEILDAKFKKQEVIGINIVSYPLLLGIVLSGNLFSCDKIIFIVLTILILLSLMVIYNDNKKYNINDALYVIGMIIFLGLSFNSLIYFRNTDISKCIYIFLIACITDSYAYLGGSLIGKHKLTTISPKKTWEGSIVGSLVGTIVGTVFYMVVIGDMVLVSVIVLSLVLTIISQIGDLVFSSIKRYFDIKDYSNLIPGHGGVLDRFDSILFVALGLSFMLLLL